MNEINSLSNQKVINWTKLKQKKYQKEYFLVEGEHLVLEALATNNLKEVITISNKIYDVNINHYLVTKEIMSKISELDSIPTVIGVCFKLKAKSLTNKVLILDNVRDPGNLGTLIRSALAFNFQTIILGSNSVSIYNSKVLRASEGMIFKLNIIEKDTLEIIKELKDKGYLIVGTNVRTGTDIGVIKTDKMALILGNEGNGIDNTILEQCDANVKINISKNCESLNVGVAGSILMYEVNHE